MIHATIMSRTVIRFYEAFYYQHPDTEQQYLVLILELGDMSMDAYLA